LAKMLLTASKKSSRSPRRPRICTCTRGKKAGSILARECSERATHLGGIKDVSRKVVLGAG
jgi:hypothetical protein